MSHNAIGSDGKVYCKHREEAAKRTSHTSKHPNREFYCCKRAQGDQTRCDFWSWADNLPKNAKIQAPGSPEAVRSPQRTKEGGRACPTSASRRTLRPLQEHSPPISDLSLTPRSERRLEDIEAGLKQRQQDLSPTRHAGPSREQGPPALLNAPAVPQPPSPVPTEIDCEVEAQPQKTYSFLGLPSVVSTTVKEEDQPSTPKKQRLISPGDVTVVQPTTDVVSPGDRLLLTLPQTTRRVIRSDEPKTISAVIHNGKGKEREGKASGQIQEQDQHDHCERGSSGEPQEDFLPLFTHREDTSTTSSASPTIAENVLDYTDGMRARVKALSVYMDSFEMTQAARLLQTIERQKNQYEFRDRSQRMRIDELVVERDKLVAEVARLKEALRRVAIT